jgi:predicted PhzF superfamily epimerase YddE/YHI9
MPDARKMPGIRGQPIVTITPMALQLTVVDAFTDTAFTGNPAAIAVVDAFPAEHRMQNVARELNLSETAFVVPQGDGSRDLRWFTPTTEVDLCGHATLAAAHVLGGAGEFHTRSGLLSCTLANDGWIEMTFLSTCPSPRNSPHAPSDSTECGGAGEAATTSWSNWLMPQPSGPSCPTSAGGPRCRLGP